MRLRRLRRWVCRRRKGSRCYESRSSEVAPHQAAVLTQKAVTTSQPAGCLDCGPIAAVTPNRFVTAQRRPKATETAACDVVTARIPLAAGSYQAGIDSDIAAPPARDTHPIPEKGG